MSTTTKARPTRAEPPKPIDIEIPQWYVVAMQANKAAASCVWTAMDIINKQGDGSSPEEDRSYRLLAFAAEMLSGVRATAGKALCIPDSQGFSNEVAQRMYDAGALLDAPRLAWPMLTAVEAQVATALIILDTTAEMLDSGPDEDMIPDVLAAIADAPAVPRVRPVRKQRTYSDGCNAVTEQQRDLIWERAERATTFTHMLHDLLCENDNVPDSSPNDPMGRTQRQFACVAAIQHELEAIDGALGYGTEVQTS